MPRIARGLYDGFVYHILNRGNSKQEVFHKDDDLSRWMQWLMTSHVRRYHQHYGSSGHIWQGRFKSFIIEKDSHLLTVLRYVERNPVRAGFVKSAKDWKWSSHKDVVNEGDSSLMDGIPIELPNKWDRFVNEALTERELEQLRENIKRQRPYGNPIWQREVSEKLGLESTLRARGRPKRREGKI